MVPTILIVILWKIGHSHEQAPTPTSQTSKSAAAAASAAGALRVPRTLLRPGVRVHPVHPALAVHGHAAVRTGPELSGICGHMREIQDLVSEMF